MFKNITNVQDGIRLVLSVDLSEELNKLSLLGDRVCLASRQLNNLKRVLVYGGLLYFKNQVRRQISRNVIHSSFGGELLSLCDRLNVSQLKDLLDALIMIFDFVKIEPFVTYYDEFKDALEKRFKLQLNSLNVYMRDNVRVVELSTNKKPSKLPINEMADFVNRFFEEKQKTRYGLENYYLCAYKDRPKTYIQIV